MNTVFIYALKDPRDGAVRYVGKAKNLHKRLGQHLNPRLDSGTHRANWVLHLARLGLRPELEILDEVPELKWEFFERAYIKVYREAGSSLTNLTDGGDGITQTPEIRAKKSALQRGRKDPPGTRANKSVAARVRCARKPPEHTLESRAKISAAVAGEKHPFFGRHHSPETRARISAAKKGCRPSPEARANQSAGQTGKKRGPYKKKEKNVLQ